MKAFVDGEWTEFEATDEEGEWQRDETQFRSWIGADFPAETGRYHLYVSLACPWAHRTLVTRKLRGLEDDITVDVVDPWRGEDGWQFTPEKDGCTPDRVNDASYLRELYVEADPDVTGRVTVPVLWDRERGTIVNNESREVMRMLDVEFEDYASGPSLLPEGLEDEVDQVLDEIYDPINDGVYRAGFADSQEAYDRAVDDLFSALDRWDSVLEDQRYLCGDRLTEADVAMFTTLVRFDHVYHTHFKCNVQRIRDYDNLWPYLRDVYQTDGVAETVDLEHIKEHYYTTHPDVNPKRLVARGPEPRWEEGHDRDEMS
ncbi:MAG: glutathione S-transferase family protein [Halobacteriales archaeon]